MADAYNTSTSLSDFARTQIHDSAILSYTNKTNNAFMMNALDVSALFGPQDTAVKFPVLPAATLQSVTEGTAIDRKQYSSTGRTLTLDTRRADLIPMTDFIRMASRQQMWADLGSALGDIAKKTIDTSLAGLYTSSPTDVTNATTTGIQSPDVLAAKDALDAANAPATGRVLVVNSDQYNNFLLTNTDFVDNDRRGASGGDPLVSGVVGSIFGFEVWMDNNVVETAGLARNMAFVRGTTPQNSSIGYALGTLAPTMSGQPYVGDKFRFLWNRNSPYLSDEMEFVFMYGVIAFNPAWIVEVQSRD